MMSQKLKEKRYRTEPFRTPRRGQDLNASGEGESMTEQSNYDDNTKMFDGSCTKQTCRGSFLEGSIPRKKVLIKNRRKRKQKKKELNFGTWNMQEDGHIDLAKLDLLIEEFKEQKLNILGLCETRWSGEGQFKRGEYTVVHSGSDKGGHRGVAVILDKYHGDCLKSYNNISDRFTMIKLNTKPAPINIIQVYAPTSKSSEEDIEDFYNKLQSIKDSIPTREICIVMGDLNAKVGEGEDTECGIGKHGLGRRNERGDMLASFCQANNLLITNTLFSKHKRRKYTWISPLDESKHQIDYIMIDKNWKSTVINSSSRPGADSDSDHNLVMARFRLKALKTSKTKVEAKFDLDNLKNPDVSLGYVLETNNRFKALLESWAENETLPNEIWEDMKTVYTQAATNHIGKKKNKPPKPFLSPEALQLAKQKRNARKGNDKVEYKRLKKETRRQIREDKKSWLADECAKITEANVNRNSKVLFDQIKKVKSQHVFNKNCSIKNKEDQTLIEKEDILNRWQEYGKSLFETDEEIKDALPCPEQCQQEPKPLLEEIDSAIKSLKCGKSPGLDNIPSELLKNRGDEGTKALHYLCTRIWETCKWPDDWKLQEFVMLHKSGDPKNCNNYRTIALISHASKILLIVILNRLKNKVESEISDCQAGYRSGRGTIDMLFVLQILIEKVRNTKEEAFITFIDYSKAFDSVQHEHLFQTMLKMGFPEHLVSLISNLYTNQNATIRWNGEHSGQFHINKGVRQGCILSPHLFSIYTEQVMREAEIDDMGITIGGRNLTNLRYADDTALIADNITSMKQILNRVDIAGKSASLKLNAKKTKVMHVNSSNTAEDITVDNSSLEYVESFKYLGSVKENNGSCSKDVRTRIGMAKQKLVQLNNIWKDRGIPITLKLAILKCLVWPVVLYGCEAWTLKQDDYNRINAVEMWFYRRLLRVSWKEKRTNDSILEELGVTRQLLNEVQKRRLRYVGHALRNTKTDLMTTVLQGKFAGKRRRGRPVTTYVSNIVKSSRHSLHTMSQLSRDRDDWRAVVMSAGDPIDEHGDGYK